MAIINRSVGNFFPLLQSNEVEGDFSTKLNQTLALVQTVHCNLIKITLNQRLFLTQEAHNSCLNIRLSQTLQLVQKVVRPKDLYVNNQLIMVQTAKKVLEQFVTQSISFIQTVEESKNVNQPVTFNQTVGIKIIRNRSLNQTFNLVQNVAKYNMEEECEPG